MGRVDGKDYVTNSFVYFSVDQIYIYILETQTDAMYRLFSRDRRIIQWAA